MSFCRKMIYLSPKPDFSPFFLAMKMWQIGYAEDFRKQNLWIYKEQSAFFGKFCVPFYWFGKFNKVFSYFLQFFFNFENQLMFSFNDPICHISPDLSPKQDLSPLFFRRENVTNRRMYSILSSSSKTLIYLFFILH